MLQQYRNAEMSRERLGEGISIYFICDDALILYHEFLQRNLQPTEPIVGNKMWLTSLRDPDGYNLNFESYTDVFEDTKYSEWK